MQTAIITYFTTMSTFAIMLHVLAFIAVLLYITLKIIIKKASSKKASQPQGLKLQSQSRNPKPPTTKH